MSDWVPAETGLRDPPKGYRMERSTDDNGVRWYRWVDWQAERVGQQNRDRWVVYHEMVDDYISTQPAALRRRRAWLGRQLEGLRPLDDAWKRAMDEADRLLAVRTKHGEKT